MSQQEDLTTMQRRLDDLVQRVEELEHTVGRLGSPAGRPRGAGPGTPAGPRPGADEALVTIPDAPYNNALWTDSDDEGLGVRDRHAP
ncbi:hypothetical protein [Streptomyces qinzhouensis]|uniref:Uncharacterized protein n=1 Tax=Streptomyces qinzhouensis TaxID=2599401 RepID=A0A5B8JM56_9ACTN|nr:hypothetical protein [Streptomyces qinzhouensis]QDY78850.1 hypothetical protein FQU76_22655 [Streptomyces qinzhouensis]